MEIGYLNLTGRATKTLPKFPKDATKGKRTNNNFVVDLPIIWNTAKKDLPLLKGLIEEMLEEIEVN
ncbi:MAG: hypothetical protein PHG79_03605 [Methanosarcina sp.]|nr:hypothetical protein [Methanosarcina sp.]MDD3872969.1 hypothetical protein [Methanosarcina sp.]MDD4522311.1 hypothetical protein [Methanosarcina sp.]HHV24725.1 hypothetical protein [Methanosarcina sp.]